MSHETYIQAALVEARQGRDEGGGRSAAYW